MCTPHAGEQKSPLYMHEGIKRIYRHAKMHFRAPVYGLSVDVFTTNELKDHFDVLFCLHSVFWPTLAWQLHLREGVTLTTAAESDWCRQI